MILLAIYIIIKFSWYLVQMVKADKTYGRGE